MPSTGMSKYRIDLLDGSNNVIGSGPLRNIQSVTHNRKLDAIPTLVFSVFGNDPKVNLIGNPDIAAPAIRFDVYHEDDGFLGRFYLADKDEQDNDGKAMVIVYCQSELQALQDLIAGFAREYSNTAIEDIIEDLLTTASWTLDPIATGDNANVTYQGQNIFEAISELLKRWNLHFRTTATASELEIGAFGTAQTDVRLTNLRGQDGANDASIGVVKSLSRKVIFKGIYNRIVAVGAGTGAGMLTLLDAQVGGTYTVQSRTRTNGQDETYIEDSTSITAYGVRELTVLFDQIRPIANTATAKTQAQTELLTNAESWLTLHKDPRTVFNNVTVYGLQTDIVPGNKVNLRYIEKDDDGNTYFEVDEDVWVIGHNRRRSATGTDIAMLTLSTLDRKELTDTEVMANTVRAVRSEKLWIKPEPFRFENTYYDLVQCFVGPAGKNADFTLSVDDTVTDLTRVVFRFKTYVLYSSTDAAGLAGHPAGGGGNYVNQGWLAMTDQHAQYPRDISMTINGVNVDNHVDVDYLSGGTGPWNPDPANAQVTVEMDVTDYILGLGNIYQDFAIQFTCLPTAALYRVEKSGAVTTSIATSSGEIEFTTKVQGIGQAIYKN